MQNKYLNMVILHISWLQLSGKIFFPENMMLPPDEKWKMVFLKKNTRKYDIYFKYSENMVFSKRIAPGHDIFCTIWKGVIFSPENMVFFSWTENERGVIFLKKYTETWHFLIDMPPCKKKKSKTILSRKNTRKGHWYSRLTP